MPDWSSLPPDLVRCIGDRLLASSDFDYYMDMRGVCRGWRSATADPRGRGARHDSRFRAEHWVLLEWKPEDDGDRLFLNLLTGRFLRRRLPLLRVYGLFHCAFGYLMLLDRSYDIVFYFLNPLTGYMFCPGVKSKPPEVLSAMAEKDDDDDKYGYHAHEFHVVSPAGEGLLIRRLHGTIKVFRKNAEGQAVVPVKSIGCHAIFLGVRSLLVDAEKLPTVDSDCIYYSSSLLGNQDNSAYEYRNEECANMYSYDLSNGRERMISSPVADNYGRFYVRRPFSLAQVLLAYCVWPFPPP